MSRRTTAVDPRFGQRLRELRQERDLTMRDLGRLVAYSHTTIWQLEHGRAQPTPDQALRLDQALCAAGRLTALVTTLPGGVLTPDDEDRLVAAARRPRSVDPAAVDSLETILGQQRRLEDLAGSGPLLAPVAAQLAMVETLVSAARGPLRGRLVGVAAQWAQFCGWLNASTRMDEAGRRWYARALEWGTEAGDANMVATALNMAGHLEWLAGNAWPMIALSQAARRQPASPGVLALAVQQEARGHAIVGDPGPVDRLLDEAATLAAEAAEHPDGEPPWVYFHSGEYLTMQRGLAYRYLGRHQEAVHLLRTGLAGIPSQLRGSEWGGGYRYQLARTLAALGDGAAALVELDEVDRVAAATGSARLAGQAAGLRQRLGAVS